MGNLILLVMVIVLIGVFFLKPIQDRICRIVNPILARRYIDRLGKSLGKEHQQEVLNTFCNNCRFYDMRHAYKIILIGLSNNRVPYALFYIRKRCRTPIKQADVERFARVQFAFV